MSECEGYPISAERLRMRADAGRIRHAGERVYHGPIFVPENIAAIVAEHPAIKRTTSRHMVMRYSHGGWTWLFRSQIPASRMMVGEIVRTPEGQIRVHLWSAASPHSGAHSARRTPAEILARRATRITRIEPPLPPSEEL